MVLHWLLVVAWFPWECDQTVLQLSEESSRANLAVEVSVEWTVRASLVCLVTNEHHYCWWQAVPVLDS